MVQGSDSSPTLYNRKSEVQERNEAVLTELEIENTEKLRELDEEYVKKMHAADKEQAEAMREVESKIEEYQSCLSILSLQ